MKLLPTVYRIELYPDSYKNDPIAAFWSSTPFVAMQKGDEIDPYVWSNGHEDSYTNKDMVKPGCVLEVTGVRHLMMMAAKDHFLQSISIKVVEKDND
ncbi:hypothetical protein [Aeromonas caviae]|uniref:hypothetical protein n=1 Tax=Aeromonas caviae TaxID=648 RepID=UPI0038D1AA83